MKKLITLLIVLICCVCTGGATTLHIGMEYNTTGDVYVFKFGKDSGNDDWDSMGDDHKATFQYVKYGRRWYTYDIGDFPKAIVRFDNWTKQTVDIENISGDDVYVYVSTTQTGDKYNAGVLQSEGWQTIKISNDVDGKWDDDAEEMTKIDDNTFTYTLTKEKITAANKSQIYFRFKLADGVFFVGDYYWNDHYYRIGSNDEENGNVSIEIASSITNNSYTTNQEKNWYVTVPTYVYEKLVFTIQDVTNGSRFDNSTWKVTVDAYISKSISAVGVATFGSEADVNFEGVAGLTAKKGKVGTDGKITWTPATTLKGGEGAFLEGEEGSYSIPVAASADADTDIEHNDFVAITTETQLAQSTTDGYTNFILTKVDDVLGFYKVNTAGSWCAAGSAYLKVADTIVGEAREFIPIVDEETTGIGDLKNSSDEEWKSSPMYNLAGQKVDKGYKGIVIVNGKKFINK